MLTVTVLLLFDSAKAPVGVNVKATVAPDEMVITGATVALIAHPEAQRRPMGSERGITAQSGGTGRTAKSAAATTNAMAHPAGRPLPYLKPSLALRIAPSASAGEASAGMPSVWRISAASTRRNGLYRSSSPIVAGTVGLPALRSCARNL